VLTTSSAITTVGESTVGTVDTADTTGTTICVDEQVDTICGCCTTVAVVEVGCWIMMFSVMVGVLLAVEAAAWAAANAAAFCICWYCLTVTVVPVVVVLDCGCRMICFGCATSCTCCTIGCDLNT